MSYHLGRDEMFWRIGHEDSKQSVGNQARIIFPASSSDISGFAAAIFGTHTSIISSMVSLNVTSPFSKQYLQYSSFQQLYF